MRKCALLLLLVPAALSAQSIQTISPRQCVWHAGDNPAWAAPNLDESGWQPWQTWKPTFSQPHLWVRCRVHLAFLSGDPRPAIQVSSFSAYQLYLDGVLMGAQGNLRNGNSSLNAIRSYPVPGLSLAAGHATIALRITNRITLSNSGPYRAVVDHPLQLRAGDATLLDAERARTLLARAAPFLPTAIGFGIVGVLAIVLIGLYFYDRSRYELLFLSGACLTLALLRINELAAAAMLNYSVSAGLVILGLGNIGITIGEVPFFYALAHRRMPWPVLALLAATAAAYIPTWTDAFVAANQPAWMGPFNSDFVRPFALLSHFAISFVPFFVFGPWRTIAGRMRPLAVLCMMWGAADIVWFALEVTILPIPGMPNLFARWGLDLLACRAFSTACVLAALLVLLFREQRQVTEDRAILAGEMQAAGEIQNMLVPARIEAMPGVRIQAAFHPMREVGGDFYQVIRRDDHSTLVVIGDVSGKGLRAAMTGTLAVGVVRTLAAEGLEPAALLRRMNREMAATQKDGFITCLCVLISAAGEMIAANAGHLAPYRNGEEIEFPSGLPIGIVPEMTYTQHFVALAPGDTLTLLSDGVVEAQNADRELFGFQRTAAVSRKPAEEIARAAQQFGQEDDITVLTLTFAPAEVLHA
ncbi:MAG: PP2C family protein-serine/threonine phosphatase [Acidobacteriota bacterium]